jgi:TetR/AcrR family transcriptional repressor of nem operon
LDSATELFWRYGYAGTSLEQIDEATGLGRGSLYNAFGDKRSLFLACLDHYGAREIGAAIAMLSGSGSAAQKVCTLFASAVDTVRLAGDRRGCLLCNAAIEVAPHDTTVEARVVKHLGSLRAAFYHILKVEQGVRANRVAAGLADQLTAEYLGLLVMAKGGFSVTHLKRIAEGACALVREI